MKIFIAASWKLQHAVEMLTAILRDKGQHEVLSFVENNLFQAHSPEQAGNPNHFEDWVNTPPADEAFKYDMTGATHSDCVIYISPSGTDAWCEVGAAYAAGVPVIGLYAKGEPSGLMRKCMLKWFDCYRDVLPTLEQIAKNQ